MTNPSTGPTGQGDGGFDYDMVGSNPAGSTNYSPSDVQSMITSFFDLHSGPLTEYENAFIMFLMQEYGAQVSGQDANMQSEMNKYFSGIQNLWTLLDSANNSSAGTAASAGLDAQFMAQAHKIYEQLNHDPFFNTPARDQMKVSMQATLANIEATVTSAEPSGTPGEYGLYNLWVQYDPSIAGGTGTGNPAQMNVLSRQLGEANAQFTGESQAVAADTKSDVKLWQTEQSTQNNYYKLISKLTQALASAQRTQ